MSSSSGLASLELLIISNDYSTLKTFVSAWRETGSRIDSTASLACARDLVHGRRMDGIVVDIGIHGACDFISEARERRGGEAPIFIACASTPQEEQAALAAGANFVVQKPVSTGKIFDLLTLGGAMQPAQRRLTTRHRLIAPVTIFSEGLQYRGLTADLSQGGMAVRSARTSEPDTSVEFFLELSSTAVAGQGTITWSDNGYSGIKFDSIRCSNRLPFGEWLERQAVLAQASISL